MEWDRSMGGAPGGGQAQQRAGHWAELRALLQGQLFLCLSLCLPMFQPQGCGSSGSQEA